MVRALSERRRRAPPGVRACYSALPCPALPPPSVCADPRWPCPAPPLPTGGSAAGLHLSAGCGSRPRGGCGRRQDACPRHRRCALVAGAITKTMSGSLPGCTCHRWRWAPSEPRLRHRHPPDPHPNPNPTALCPSCTPQARWWGRPGPSARTASCCARRRRAAPASTTSLTVITTRRRSVGPGRWMWS